MSMKIKRGTIPEIRPNAPLGLQRDKKLGEMLLGRAGWGGPSLPAAPHAGDIRPGHLNI